MRYGCAFVAGVRKCTDRRKSLVGRTAKRSVLYIESFIKGNKQGDGWFMPHVGRLFCENDDYDDYYDYSSYSRHSRAISHSRA